MTTPSLAHELVPCGGFLQLKMFKRVPSVFWIVLMWWTAYALIFATQVIRMGDQQGQPISWQEALQFSFGGWMTWVPLSLGLYWLVKRSPIERDRVLRSLSVLMLGAVAVVVLRAIYVYLTNSFFAWYGDQALPGFGSVLSTAFSNNFMLAWLVIGISHAMVSTSAATSATRKWRNWKRA